MREAEYSNPCTPALLTAPIITRINMFHSNKNFDLYGIVQYFIRTLVPGRSQL